MITAERVTKLLTKENMIAWLKTKPGSTEYDYSSNKDCLLARYLRAALRVRKDQIIVTPWSVYFPREDGTLELVGDIPPVLDDGSRKENRQHRHTYGTALRALRAKPKGGA